MASSLRFVSLMQLSLLVGVTFVSGNFLAIHEAGRRSHGHAMSTDEVKLDLNAALESIMGNHGVAEEDRVAAIEASIWRTFQALPKNKLGRLAPASVRYIVHNYFSKEHGWLIEGLEHQNVQTSMLGNATILQEKAPAMVEALLEDREHGRGLSFEDIVVMITALERLIAHESSSLLEVAYAFNGLKTSGKIDADVLHEVLTSYLLLFRLGDYANHSDVEYHHMVKARVKEMGTPWELLSEFETDTVLNFAYADRHELNPFKSQSYSFEASAQIVGSLTHNYGKWQNADCIAMKEHLMSFDSQGSGRVPLDVFYAQPTESAYHFHESTEYLQSIGALDDSVGGIPQVRIANYVLGPTNCIARSAFFSVCCLNECDGLMNEIEGVVQAPMASPEQLHRFVAGLHSSSVDAPRQLSKVLVEKLQAIADLNAGAVPLHGRLFKQWLHFAFPNECPYPQQVEAAVMKPQQWADGKAIASADEMVMHLEAGLASDTGSLLPESSMSQWSDEEVLPLHDARARPKHGQSVLKDSLGMLVRIAPLLVVARLGYSGLVSARRAHSGGMDAKKELGHMV